MNRIVNLSLILPLFLIINIFAETKPYVPEKGSVENQKNKKGKQVVNHDKSLPNVLIVGDSISIGYTPFVRKALKGKANVIHNKGNAQGTTFGLANIKSWIATNKFSVIHFNFGLHDLNHVKEAGTSKNSDSFDDPQQADLATYSKNLAAIVKILKATGIPLVYATTTPYPAGVKPARLPADCDRYNEAAIKIMKDNNIPVNDLHGLVKNDLKTLQIPKNVHFRKSGSEKMGKAVAVEIQKYLK